MQVLDVAAGVGSVLRRHGLVYGRHWRHSLVTTFAEPLLYLLSFGLGMSAVVRQVVVGGVGVEYRAFVFAGIVAQSVLYQGFFSAAYGGYARMHQQRIYLAILTTPVTLRELLGAELLWNASRGTLAAAAILLIGTLAGDFRPWGALAALPLAFAGALLFSGLGLCIAALARNFNDLSNAQFYVVFPSFLLAGVLFPLDALPTAARACAWLLPLTPVLDLLRALLLGTPPAPAAALALPAWVAFAVWAAERTATRRLVK